MTSDKHDIETLIDPLVVRDDQDVARWAWLRDHSTTDQLEILCSAIKGANSRYARQKAVEEVTDHFVAQLLLSSSPRRRKVTPPERFHIPPVIHLPFTASA